MKLILTFLVLTLLVVPFGYVIAEDTSSSEMLSCVASPATISGPSSVCKGSTVVYTVSGIDTGWLTDYSFFTSGSGLSVISQSRFSITVSFSSTFTTGSVIAYGIFGACGAPYTAQLTVTGTTGTLPGNAGTISGITQVAPNSSSVPYSVAAISGATSYNWSMPSGAYIVYGSGTQNIYVHFDQTFKGGTMYVAGKNATCLGSSSSLEITSTGCNLLSAPSSITGSSSVCPGQSVTYSISSISGATDYVWTLPNGSTQISTTPSTTIAYTESSSSGTLRVYPRSGSCYQGQSSSKSVTVNNTNITINNPGPVCSGMWDGSAVFTASTTYNGTNYRWFKNNIAVTDNGPGVPSYVYSPTGVLAAGDQIKVIGDVTNSCGTKSNVVSNVITITTKAPLNPSIFVSMQFENSNSNVLELCVGGTIKLKAVKTNTSITLGTIYWYKYNKDTYGNPIPGSRVSVGQGTEYLASVNDLDNYCFTFEAYASGTCVTAATVVGSTQYIPFIYTNEPAPIGDIIGSKLVCQTGDQVTSQYEVNSNNPSNMISWSISNTNAGSINSSGLVSWNPSFVGTASVFCDATNSCGLETSYVPVEVVSLGSCLNSITTTLYIPDGSDAGSEPDIVGQSRSYFDHSGQLLQSQSKSIADNKYLLSEPLYDTYGRAAGQSMTAPINANEFAYQPKFAQDIGGNAFDAVDLETNQTMGAVGNTLGGYYSNSNTQEPNMATTTYPYSKTEYYEDGSGEVKSQMGVGDIYRTSADRKTYSKTFPVFNDLDGIYRTIYNQLFDQNVTSFAHKLVKTASKNANGEHFISYSDGQNTWVTGYAQPITSDPNDLPLVVNYSGINNVDPVTDDINIFDFYVPQSIAVTGSGTKINLLTNVITTGTFPSGFYRCTNCSGIAYNFSIYHPAFNFYNLKGQLVASVSPLGVQQLLKATSPYVVNSNATAMAIPYTTYYSYDYQGRLVSMKEPDAGVTNYMYRRDGSIRFSQNAEQKELGRFSYTNYDPSGRPIESGEYTGPAQTIANGTNAFLVGKLENKTINGGLFANENDFTKRKDWVRTYYDMPVDAGLTATKELTSYSLAQTKVVATTSITLKPGFSVSAGQTFSASIRAAVGYQTYTFGAVSYSENENTKTYYSYDEQGRVMWMSTLYKNITDPLFAKPKKVEYIYDFVGNVTEVKYEAGKSDAFYHYYKYDANQRLSKAYASTTAISATSTPEVLLQALQAEYIYYQHGPLKQVILANGLETTDYYYTVQGMLKSINNPNNLGSDRFAMTIGYYKDDYTNTNTAGTGKDLPVVQTNTTYNQYAGNIGTVRWNRRSNPTTVVDMTMNYVYDVKGQLRASDNPGTNSVADAFNERGIQYDANGNILTLIHNNGSGGTLVSQGLRHNFTYDYDDHDDLTPLQMNNQLRSVKDNVGKAYATYEYNKIGQMWRITRDNPADLATTETMGYTYDVTGKVINYSKDGIIQYSYAYDDRGFRIAKRSTLNTGKNDIYVRDASGNILAIYETEGGILTPKEHPIYGSGKIGTYYQTTNTENYELTDHLGSVRAVIARNGDITQGMDYYPYGMEMSISNPGDYRYGYQGQFAEKDDETGFNHFELRDYDAIIGRWMNTDPYRQHYSGYLGMGNNPISLVDPDGGEDLTKDPATLVLADQNAATASRPTIFEIAAYVSSLPFAQRMAAFGFQPGGKFNQIAFSPEVQNSLNTVGAGFGVDFFIGPGGGVSIDRVLDNEGGNDLYLTYKVGYGADINANVHGAIYNGSYGPKDIIGGFSFIGGGYGPPGYEFSGSIQYVEGIGPVFGRIKTNSISLGVGTKYLTGGLKGGVGYTFNLSDIGRYLNGYNTRSDGK